MKIRKVVWNAYCSWYWNINEENTCSICQNGFEHPCQDCTVPGVNCPPVESTCSHIFHSHCINKWFSSQQSEYKELIDENGMKIPYKDKCPNCRQIWKVKKNYGDETNVL